MSKFIPWVNDEQVIENTNVYDYANFSGVNSQSKSGFQSGNIISSIYVNSALRQANLVVAALMDATGNSSLDLTSSVTDVKTALQTYFASLAVASATKATNDEDNNNIKSTYAKQNGTYANMSVGSATNAASATNASNVTTKINNVNISTIFESDGSTVKNATNSTNSTNATNATNTATNLNNSSVKYPIYYNEVLSVNNTIFPGFKTLYYNNSTSSSNRIGDTNIVITLSETVPKNSLLFITTVSAQTGESGIFNFNEFYRTGKETHFQMGLALASTTIKTLRVELTHASNQLRIAVDEDLGGSSIDLYVSGVYLVTF